MGQGRHKEENITRRQAEVMQEICRFFSTYGKMPRMQQLADAFGISVPSIYDILQELVSKGYLKRIEKGATKPYVINKAVEPEALVTVQIPVLGEIPGGVPVEEFEDRSGDETVSVDKALTTNGDVFALRVKGDSMIGAGIRTDGNDEVFRLNSGSGIFAISNHHALTVHKAGSTFENCYTGSLEQTGNTAAEFIKDFILAFEHLCPVGFDLAGDLHAEVSGMAGRVQNFRTGNQGLGRYATDIQTGTAEVALFDQSGFQTLLTGFDRCNITAGAGTDNADIKFFHRHNYFLPIFKDLS